MAEEPRDQDLLSPPEIASRRYGQLLIDRIAGLILDNIFGIILLSLGVTSFVQSLLLFAFITLRDDPNLSWIVAGAVFSAAFLVLLALRALRPNLPPPPADYKIETLKIQMEYLSREHAIYSRSFRLIVLQDGLDRFRDTFHWTGSRVAAMTSSDRFHTIVLTDEGGLYSFYEVQFNSKFNRGDKIDFTITWELEDDKRAARPFVSRQVNRPCREMSFFVKLYPGSHEAYSVAQIAISPSDRTNSTQRRIAFGANGIVSWIVRRPQLAYYYELRWAGKDWQ